MKHFADTQHCVQFYETEQHLSEVVTNFLHEGLAVGAPVIVIATRQHRDIFRNRLIAAGHDFDGASAAGDITCLDAAEALEMFMVDGMPDEHLFKAHFGGLMDRTMRGRQPARIRAFGEMVDVLVAEGNAPAGIRLEALWNRLAENYDFDLLCAYGMDRFSTPAGAQLIAEVCECHSHVSPSETYTPKADEETRAREIVRLQQTGVALEHEIATREQMEGRLREALEEAERARHEAESARHVKSDFLAVMSHELRTPLNALIGFHDLLEYEVAGPLTPKQRAYLSRLKASADELTRLIDQVLSLARIESGRDALEMEPVELSTLIRELVEFMSPIALHKQLALTGSIAHAPLIALADYNRLRHVLLNLLIKSMKFTREGGVDVHARREGDLVCVQIRATGVGAEPIDLDQMVANVIGGDLNITRVSGGTVFTLQLPAAAVPAARPDAHAQAKLYPPIGPNASRISPHK